MEFALKFAVDLIDLIEGNHRNSKIFRGLLGMKIDQRYGEVGMCREANALGVQKCYIIFTNQQ